jgi:hypothetical protein
MNGQRRRPPQHRRVVVRHGTIEAEVDEGIADVILATWRAGIVTEESCQGRHDEASLVKMAYVAFHAPEAERWTKIVCADAPWLGEVDHSTYPPTVTGGEDGPLSREQEAWLKRHREQIGYEGPRKRLWRYEFQPFDGWGMSVHFSVLICFPSNDIGEVLARLREHNTKKKGARDDA